MTFHCTSLFLFLIFTCSLSGHHSKCYDQIMLQIKTNILRRGNKKIKGKVMGNEEKNKKKANQHMRWWVNKVFFTNPQGLDSLSLSFAIHFFSYILLHNKRNSSILSQNKVRFKTIHKYYILSLFIFFLMFSLHNKRNSPFSHKIKLVFTIFKNTTYNTLCSFIRKDFQHIYVRLLAIIKIP